MVRIRASLVTATTLTTRQVQGVLASLPTLEEEKIQELLDKLTLGEPLSSIDMIFFSVYKGFTYAKEMGETFGYTRASLSVSTHNLKELESISPTPVGSAQYCTECQAGHVGQIFAQNCNLKFSEGPKMLEELQQTDIWRAPTKIVSIGHRALFYLPNRGNLDMLNLGMTKLGTYRLGMNLDFQILKGPGSLYTNLMNRLDLVGLNSDRPVLIEFAFMKDRRTTRAIDHLFGFGRVISSIQQEYYGPLIVVIPPSHLRKGDTPAEYEQAKKSKELFNRQALVIGKVLGFAVHVMHVQSIPLDQDKGHLRLAWWLTEPLYNLQGEITREFQNRMMRDLLLMRNALCNISRPYPGIITREGWEEI
jgi:hypothetical protein